jgi:hypothetical protein
VLAHPERGEACALGGGRHGLDHDALGTRTYAKSVQSDVHPAIIAGRRVDVNDDPVAVLQRWEDAGAYWRVLSRNNEWVTVGLFRCDGGEEVDRFTSNDAELLQFVGERDGNFA